MTHLSHNYDSNTENILELVYLISFISCYACKIYFLSKLMYLIKLINKICMSILTTCLK